MKRSAQILLLAVILSIGGGGAATAAPQPPRPPHVEIAVDSAGRIVAALGGGSGRKAAIVRLDSAGQLDASFAGDGSLGPRTSAKPAALALLPGDRLLAAEQAPGARPKLRRFFADGSLDRSFGDGGAVPIPVVPANRLLVQPDGHFLILVVWTCPSPSCGYTFSYLEIRRYAANGRLLSKVTHYGELWHLDAAELDAKGRLLVAGGVSDLAYQTYGRFRPAGRFDRSLGGREGLKIYEDDEFLPDTSALAVQSDGGFVLAAGEEAAELRRRSSSGKADRGFGDDGVVVCSPPAPVRSSQLPFTAVSATPDGAILAAGGEGLCGLVRYLSNGTPDPAFGTGGKVDLEAQGMARPLAMAIGPGGDIAVAGWDPEERAVKIARLSALGQLDSAFGVGGVVSLSGF